MEDEKIIYLKLRKGIDRCLYSRYDGFILRISEKAGAVDAVLGVYGNRSAANEKEGT